MCKGQARDLDLNVAEHGVDYLAELGARTQDAHRAVSTDLDPNYRSQISLARAGETRTMQKGRDPHSSLDRTSDRTVDRTCIVLSGESRLLCRIIRKFQRAIK